MKKYFLHMWISLFNLDLYSFKVVVDISKSFFYVSLEISTVWKILGSLIYQICLKPVNIFL